ncbi:transposase [Streptomyces sp. NPDC051014]|uniref:IS110 family transposase n=1 Tax=Streptomyces sp. NPDC051014 TaxID=3155751 RepID=UPI0033CC916F
MLISVVDRSPNGSWTSGRRTAGTPGGGVTVATGEGTQAEGRRRKTGAKGAAVIADQARIRRDPHPLRTGDETVTNFKILTSRRTDLVADRTRTVNRLRAHLTDIFPGLKRALDLTNTCPLTLLTGYQTPASLRRTGKKCLATWLRNRNVPRADRLAREVMSLNQQVAELDKAIGAGFREHRNFEVIASLGIILGAGFLATTGGGMTAFGTADRLAGFGGVTPVPRDSGKISGNLRRPRRYNRRLQRVFYISALFSIRHSEDSRRFYERNRAEGKHHSQAVLTLAHRRVNVL